MAEKKTEEQRKPRTHKKKGGWVKPTIFGTLAVLFLTPIIAFMVAYMVAEVPEPDELVLDQVSEIYASDGVTQLARIVPPEGNRREVPLAQIPEVTRNAVLAAEDREFYTNSGFSFTGFGRAVIGQITGDASAGGGSTITQQYVKNMLVGNAHSYERKAKELVYSIKMTNEWTKEEVLGSYLNTIYFGRNAYGIDAAANAYFGIPSSELNVAQSAVLAASIQLPSQLDPWTNPAGAESRWNYVLDGMVSEGWLSAAERAELTYPETQDPALYQAYTEATGTNGLIQSQVMAELTTLGITQEEVQTLGLRITSTIDMQAQNATVEAVNTNIADEQDNVRVAAVSVEPATGAVRAYYGGEEATGYDYANAALQTGSTFKVFGLAAAVQQGIPTSTYYSSAPYTLPGNIVVKNAGETPGCGQCSIKEALKHSYNTSFIRLQEDLENTTQDTADMAHALGIAESLPGIEKTLTENGEQPYEGIILGQYQSRPLDMAHAIATLANLGVRHDVYFVQRVETVDGKLLYEHEQAEGQRAVSEAVATNVLDAMMPIAAYSKGNALANGRESAAKTGTAQLGDTGYNKDAWMVGATPQLATAVWAGTADNSPLFNSWGGLMYGADLPADIWKDTLDGALSGKDLERFPDRQPVNWAGYGYGSGYSQDSWSGQYNQDSGSQDTVEEVAPAPEPEVPDTDADTGLEIIPGVVIPNIFG
ncbi:putative penicillin-binding protein 1 [Corynebacterium kutscheri]|uniref:Membrane carboxypeptidase (Penicillin-binding protein) n=1 Tax=Corynebacterium kutscheri TaxID=35755 RepID=A0A0F6TE63_9CORY|nr:transglycosylase domain-containing protein [Corynebacterium kutscheri]AKE42194.1 membrane carboxypeptidase (penicillin-binding protein) [Corynebacterium kutscheri]VEH10537.1 putative penicillin-binding protein 1 [Corynebacterium kutscheri]VEH81681.1 putative penicillin-binding protein 1 [Corynebacterium kutscheri]